MQDRVPRQPVRFRSGRADCAAWHYPGTNGACVVMAGGFAVTKEPGTDLFAERFQAAGYTVLAFDYRHLGESSGQPRQVVRVRDQLADWQAAVRCATDLPEVDAARVALWGFSLSGGHVVRVAARSEAVAGAIAQTPNLDGPATTRNAARHQHRSTLARLLLTSALDKLRSGLGLAPLLVPLVGPPGTLAVLTTPDGIRTNEVLNPGNRYPSWPQVVAARSILALGLYRPGLDARRVRCPVLFVACEHDQSALAEPARRAAQLAPRGELVCRPGDHYSPFTDAHEEAAKAELAFLNHHLHTPADDHQSTIAMSRRPARPCIRENGKPQ